MALYIREKNNLDRLYDNLNLNDPSREALNFSVAYWLDFISLMRFE